MIYKLHLHNFKCFENQSFQLKPLTLLTGLNSTGKSSVLQSLLLLRQSYLEGLLATTGLMLKGHLMNIGVGKDALFEGARGDEIGIDIALQNGIEEELVGEWRFRCDRVADVLDLSTLSPVVSNVYDTALFKDNFQYLQAERIGPRLFFETSDFQVRRHRQLGTRGEYAVHFLSIWGDDKVSDCLAHKKAPSLTLLSQVEAWLGEISPGTRITLNPNAGMELVELRYSSQFGNLTSNSSTLSSNDYRSTNVGFGITYVLPVIVAILSSLPNALLLIENPEAHLHPRGQAQMGELLARAASYGVQIVVETHSDHILNGIRLAVHDGKLKPDDVQLHFFQRRERDAMIEITSPRIDRDGRIDKWPDGFFDEWERDLIALLEPRGE
jgi:predicted ATPase